MNDSVQIISLLNLSITFLPVFAVLIIFYKWSLDTGNAFYAVARMLCQLLLIGYFLTFIFQSGGSRTVVCVLIIMIFSSSWIALSSIKSKRTSLYKKALIAIGFGGGIALLTVIKGVLQLDPWYKPSYIIPLAGMIFATAMNSVSLAAERLNAEMKSNVLYKEARKIAYRTSLIPIINSLFAVGLVSLPGMMTGQILSGIAPLIAVRYQIMVMCMVFSASGISAAFFLFLTESDFNNK